MGNAPWLYFFVSATGVIAAGMMIGRVSGELGERLKLGRAWSGAVLLSFATTLPELATIVTVAMRGEAGMALGAVFGSVIFNLFILVLIDFIDPQSIYRKLSFAHIGTGLIGCMLLGLAITGIALGHAGIGGAHGIGLGHVGIISIGIFCLYLLGQYAIFRAAQGRDDQSDHVKLKTTMDGWPLRKIILAYGGLAFVIVVAAFNLGVAAEGLASYYQLGATFAGATLLGIVTSLPEITNAITCARQREHDLAVGNILGANAMVLSIIFIVDLFYINGRFLYVVGQSDAIASISMAGLAIVMQSLAIGALAVRSQERVWHFGIVSVLLAILYGLSLIIAYHFSSSV